MNNKINEIRGLLKQIKKITLHEKIMAKCDRIGSILTQMQKEGFDVRALLDANRKLVDDKNLVINDILVLLKYISGDSSLGYQVKNIMKNYKIEKVVQKW